MSDRARKLVDAAAVGAFETGAISADELAAIRLLSFDESAIDRLQKRVSRAFNADELAHILASTLLAEVQGDEPAAEATLRKMRALRDGLVQRVQQRKRST